jgi:hypothetical protein
MAFYTKNTKSWYGRRDGKTREEDTGSNDQVWTEACRGLSPPLHIEGTEQYKGTWGLPQDYWALRYVPGTGHTQQGPYFF